MASPRIAAALAAAALFGLGATGSASAQGYMVGDWYGKAFGGFAFPQDNDLDLDGGDIGTDYDSGYALGAGLGYATPNWAIELEYTYRTSDVDLDPDIGSGGGDAETDALMLNALYKFGGLGGGMGTDAWTPYLGGGLGFANVDIDGFDEDALFAYQAMAGISYEFRENVALFGEVRYFGTEDGDLSGPGSIEADSSVESIDLLFGATFTF